ncbi:hypothetical protein [Amycolatopsis suaedae]|uniref:hypothetical protein n=1 Tax=Amycolatopsis suaedae TaxID=2510978 RepID=UPI0013EF1179|nr:hypothetical protein [Amycolatopsis suaedae]
MVSKRAQQIRAASVRDNELLKKGRITEREFWSRVHKRDAELRRNPELRAEVNQTGWAK